MNNSSYIQLKDKTFRESCQGIFPHKRQREKRACFIEPKVRTNRVLEQAQAHPNILPASGATFDKQEP
jgi:hypothetical protein